MRDERKEDRMKRRPGRAKTKAKSEAKTTAKGNGPSLDDEGETRVFMSAAQLAGLANVLPRDIQYWGRLGYLSTGEEEGQRCELRQLPKARLMALFTKRLQMKAKKASELADDLLRVYRGKADELNATIALVQALETRITEFVDLIVELDLVPRIAELLRKEKTTPT